MTAIKSLEPETLIFPNPEVLWRAQVLPLPGAEAVIEALSEGASWVYSLGFGV